MTGLPNPDFSPFQAKVDPELAEELGRSIPADAPDDVATDGRTVLKLSIRTKLLAGTAAAVVIAVVAFLVLRRESSAPSISEGDKLICTMASEITHPINDYYSDLGVSDFKPIAAQATDGVISKFSADLENQADLTAATPDLDSIVARCLTLGFPPSDPDNDAWWATSYAADVVGRSAADILRGLGAGTLTNTWIDSSRGIFFCGSLVTKSTSDGSALTRRTLNYNRLPTPEELQSAQLTYNVAKSYAGDREFDLHIPLPSGDVHGYITAASGAIQSTKETVVLVTGISFFDSNGQDICH